ncbi:MAG: PKD domain-containing protein [Candidatus Bipolaricaulis sp.]|nr:PKD domain-containing protein [Candidatus Bipolaricaulis sp.]
MRTTCRRALALVVLMVGFSSLAAVAVPGFSDRNIAAGNLNPTDTIKVQEIRVTRSVSETVTLSSITVQNLGTAGDGDIDKITVLDGGDELGSTTNIAGLATGVTINLGGFNMTSTTHDLKIQVTVGTAVDDGATVNLRCKVYYVRNGASGSSAWISDLTGETIVEGGFDVIEDSSPDAGYLNPSDKQIVQITVFTDNDANSSAVFWTNTGANKVLEVENRGTADDVDIDEICVTISIAGVPYTTGYKDWDPGSAMPFNYNDFIKDDPEDQIPDAGALPLFVADNAGMTVTVRMKAGATGDAVDKRTIRTETTAYVTETGEGSVDESDYVQASTSKTTQTIRDQGFERIEEESESLGSGTAATGEVVTQTVRATDDDSNDDDVTAWRVYIRNTGSAKGDELEKIVVKAGTKTLLTLTGAELNDFITGKWYLLDDPTFVVDDDEDQVFKFYYTIATPTDGHTLRPAVRIEGRENAENYPSDQVTYPDVLALYEPGFEFVENMTPPEGGTACSSQRLLAQTIRAEDRDEDDDDVAIHPVVVRNLGTATGTDVTKIEVWRRDTEGGVAVKLGETTDLSGFRTGGARVETTHDNIVADADGGSEVFLDIYLTIAEPEAMTANRTIQLVTRVLHTENLNSYDKDATSNQWTLETNHRPVVTITFAAAAAVAAAAKADFTYEDTIQFTGAATDSDGDAISSWHWDFGDGTTSDVQNPTHQYPNGGTFTVTLTVTDERGVTGTATKTITVEGPPNVPPTVDFTWTPTAPASAQNVTFTATITDSDQPAGTAYTYAWDFGDATTSTAASPVHAFAANQSYTVKLTVTDAGGGTGTAEHVVGVGNTIPVVTALTATPTAPTTGDAVTFTATATDEDDEDTIASFTFDFGDGSDDAVVNVAALSAKASGSKQTTHTYAAAGDYTVSVIATDSRGAESAAKTIEITVTGPTQVIVSAYPNPASSQATFEYFLPDGATDVVLRVYRLDGKLIYEATLNASATTYVWDLTDDDDEALANGLYFCVVTATDEDGKTIRSEVFRLLVTQ